MKVDRIVIMALVYGCCFWFSLRLGGILIGIFSIALAFMTVSCIGYTHIDIVKTKLTEWNNQFNLIYSEDFMESVFEDPKKYILLNIICTCIYMFACVIYVYGAYICNTILMLSYIILELLRLIFISVMVAAGLLFLKQNTMDIGSLIGASVVGGFFLLGMFYLWVCAANLPILINEIERDEQAATIAKLQQLLESNQRPKRGFDNIRYSVANDHALTRNVFVVSNRNKPLESTLVHRSRIPVPY